MQEPILQVRHLKTPLVIDDTPYLVVDDLSFDLFLGKTLALVGESGCGKTLTALSLMRILPKPPCLPSTGEVIYKGKNLLDISERQMRHLRGGKIAMIFQDPQSALNPVYTIGQQIVEAIELHLGLYGKKAYEKAINALEEVGIQEPKSRFDDYPHQLSGGMKQRVMIAIALVAEPDILIADEPTTALDVTIQAQVLQLIRNLQRKKGMALLLITHDLGVVAEMADDVIVMYAAEAMEKGTVFQIFENKAHPYTMGLFGSLPNLDHPEKRLTPILGTVPSLNDMPSGCRFHPRCPYKMEKCTHGEIPYFDVNGDHKAKCLLYDGTEESLNAAPS